MKKEHKDTVTMGQRGMTRSTVNIPPSYIVLTLMVTQAAVAEPDL